MRRGRQKALSSISLTGLLLLAWPVGAAEITAAVESGAEQGLQAAGPADETEPAAAPALPALLREGYRLLDEEEFDEAGRVFAAVMQRQPRNHMARTGQGIVLARQGELQQAEDVLREALILHPNPIRTHYELGRVYEQLGDLDRALLEYRAAIDKFRQGRR